MSEPKEHIWDTHSRKAKDRRDTFAEVVIREYVTNYRPHKHAAKVAGCSESMAARILKERGLWQKKRSAPNA